MKGWEYAHLRLHPYCRRHGNLKSYCGCPKGTKGPYCAACGGQRNGGHQTICPYLGAKRQTRKKRIPRTLVRRKPDLPTRMSRKRPRRDGRLVHVVIDLDLFARLAAMMSRQARLSGGAILSFSDVVNDVLRQALGSDYCRHGSAKELCPVCLVAEDAEDAAKWG